MRLTHGAGVALAVMLGFGACGCGSSDPVAATSGGNVTVAPEATQGEEGAIKAQADQERRQAEADAAAGRN